MNDPVVEANRALLLKRSQLGINKYGVTLASSGLSRRQLLQHALEESLDLANYLQAELMREDAEAAQRQLDKERDQQQASAAAMLPCNQAYRDRGAKAQQAGIPCTPPPDLMPSQAEAWRIGWRYAEAFTREMTRPPGHHPV